MNIAIIGGGAAGMMAAATIVESGQTHTVTIFEKNAKIGVKVAISGGGRCNVTTGIEDIKTVLKKYPRGGKFLTSALYAFGPKQIREWFAIHGLTTKKEEDLRVFPASDRGQDVVDLFLRIFQERGVGVRYKEAVISITKQDSGYVVTTKNAAYAVDAVVLALGGQAYRHTGSTGDGYALAEACGHTITALAPSLNALVLKEDWIGELAGVSLPWVTLSSQENSRCSASGPIVFTHRGISGPAVFAYSSQVAFVQYSKEMPLAISLDYAPRESYEAVLRHVQYYCIRYPRRQFLNAIREFLPQSCCAVLGQAHGLPLTTSCAEVSKQQQLKAVDMIKKSTLHAIGRASGDEFVTAGGVSLAEVSPKTGESLISPGLYFAGEILDVDGYTGGFNLTASWAMGRAVGQAILSRK